MTGPRIGEGRAEMPVQRIIEVMAPAMFQIDATMREFDATTIDITLGDERGSRIYVRFSRTKFPRPERHLTWQQRLRSLLRALS